MKKGLSVLLIAAALFGFYGSAVNLNDILACKDYWEEAGEKSTADMNKLEDGLNQLKDNEQAYLDGKDQLAEGEQTLAAGEAQYAQGLADYAAAPGKLAAGEKQLAEGEDSYADLKRLIAGLKKARKHGVKTTKKHDTYWHDAFANALKPGKTEIVNGLKQAQAAGVLPLLETLSGRSGLASKAEDASKKSYPAFDDVVTKELIPAFNTAAASLTSFAGTATSKANQLQSALAGYNGLTNLEGNWEAISAALPESKQAMTAENEEFVVDNNPNFAALKPAFSGMSARPHYSEDPATMLLRGGVASQLSEFLGGDQGKMLQGIAAKGNPAKAKSADATLADKVAALVYGMNQLSPEGGAEDAVFTGYMPQVIAGLNEAAGLLTAYAQSAKDNAAAFQTWDDGYQTLAAAKDGKDKDDLASRTEGIPFAFNSMLTNKTVKAALKKYDKKLIKELKKYKGDRLKNDSMTEFDDDLVYISKKLIPRSLKVLAKVKASATKQLADGRKQLAQGRADYAAAPGKLADAERQLADGRAALAAGKEQLAQYEDGEQQVRDGLATLVGTEADLELESILDRLNGDDDFDNGDEHLDIDEGLAAVDVGRGYQAEDGVLITNEIMARAVGTGALLGAGVLAVLAAILSFLKKNKGAGVAAILAAAAGAFGAYYGTNAGTYFSDIAGSTAGNAAWVAAGILGCVALVHAIVHFTAKKEA